MTVFTIGASKRAGSGSSGATSAYPSLGLDRQSYLTGYQVKGALFNLAVTIYVLVGRVSPWSRICAESFEIVDIFTCKSKSQTRDKSDSTLQKS